MLLLVEAQEMAFLKLKRCTARLNARRSAKRPKDVKILSGIHQNIRILMCAGQRKVKTSKQDKIVSEKIGTCTAFPGPKFVSNLSQVSQHNHFNQKLYLLYKFPLFHKNRPELTFLFHFHCHHVIVIQFFYVKL